MAFKFAQKWLSAMSLNPENFPIGNGSWQLPMFVKLDFDIPL